MRKRQLLVLPIVIALFLVIIAAPSISQSVEQKYLHVSGTYTAARTTPNIVRYGDFENNLSALLTGNWQVIASDQSHTATLTQTTDAHSGLNSGLLTVTQNPKTGGFVAFSQSTFYWGIGLTYELTFFYKSTLSSCNAYVFCKSQQTTTGSDIAYWASGNMPPTNTWTQVNMTFGPIPSGTVDLQIHFGPPEGTTGTLLIDDVSTQFGATPSPTPTPNPTTAPTENPSPTPTATPSTTPNPTPSPTATPTPTNEPSPTPTQTATPNPTQDPTTTPHQTDDPTVIPSETAQPTPASTPAIPELSTIAIVIAVIISTAIVLSTKKHSKTLVPKRGALIATIIAILLFALIANIIQAQTTAQTTSNTEAKFSLWFTNGTALPTDGTNVEGYVNGGWALNVGGIRCIASGYGSSAPQMTNVIMLTNDGNTPINVTLALKNTSAPSNIQIFLFNHIMNPEVYSPYSKDWVRLGNVATKNPIMPQECAYLGITVILGQTNVPTSGTPNYNFDYSFDIEVTATQT